MSNPAAARAEQALRRRHHEAWPRNLYVYDADEARVATGRKLLLEAPAGAMAVAAEYKAIDEGPVDLANFQFQVRAPDHRPALAVQFTHPETDPPQPWAFRLWPLNRLAEAIAPVTLTEQKYIQLLYVLSRGNVSAGGGVGWIRPWNELAHLDDKLPDPTVWPAVKPARFLGAQEVKQVDLEEGHRFVATWGEPIPGARMPQANVSLETLPPPTAGLSWRARADWGPDRKGRSSSIAEALAHLEASFRTADDQVGGTPNLASVTPLREDLRSSGAPELLCDPGPADRKVPGTGNFSAPGPAPVRVEWNREDADRWDRSRWELGRWYRAMWERELGSDDNRDLWRAWNSDGTRRWSA